MARELRTAPSTSLGLIQKRISIRTTLFILVLLTTVVLLVLMTSTSTVKVGDKDYWVKKNGLLNNASKTMLERLVNNLPGTVAHKKDTRVNVLVSRMNSNTSIIRQINCIGCFEHNFKYIIQNEHICEGNATNTIDLVLFILTIHKNVDARNAIRESWLSRLKNNTHNVRYAFLLGETTDDTLKAEVVNENEIYHDIIKENFVDTYNNLTYKTIMGFKWVSEMCARARYVMKTDDDMFVNIQNLLKTLDSMGSSEMQTSIIGSCHQVAGPIRDVKSKWYASVNSYPEKSYPGFCSGTGYATSMSVAQKIYEISPHVPFFHLEDVYIALCIRKLKYHLQPVNGFNTGHPSLNPCNYKAGNLITAHQLTPANLKTIWDQPCRTS